ncbi:MAG: hypothetical protein Q9165_001308 [Trypethelium subeluteriae]
MAEAEQSGHEIRGPDTRPFLPPSQIERPNANPDASSTIDIRRRPRPKFASYITGQRPKLNQGISSDRRQDYSTAASFDPWQSYPPSQGFSSPAAPPETSHLLESILMHVLAHPFEPLPAHFTSAFPYIAEAFQKLRDELADCKTALREESTARQAEEDAWMSERQDFEQQIERLQNLVNLRPKIENELKKGSQGLMDLNKTVGFQYPSQSPTPSGTSVLASRTTNLRSARSEVDLRGTGLTSSSNWSDIVTRTPNAQDAKNLQTIASIISKRQGIPTADVWNDVTYLYYDRFKAKSQEMGRLDVESLTSENKPALGRYRVDDTDDHPIRIDIAQPGRHPSLTKLPDVRGHRRDFSFNLGDDSMIEDANLTLPLEPSSTGHLRGGDAPTRRDDLLHSGNSPRSSVRSSTTPESERRSWDCWKRSRIPSPVQDCSFLARPRRESSVSTMLTETNTHREDSRPPLPTVPRVALTLVEYLQDDKNPAVRTKPIQVPDFSDTRVPHGGKSAPKRLLQMKSAESLKKMGDTRLTTSNLARKMKNIGSSSRSPTR